MKPVPRFSDVVLGVIRSELPVATLETVGIRLVLKEGHYELKSQGGLEVVTPSVLDLARGMLAHLAHPTELKPWAFFVLGESGAIDLEEVESHPQGELLISALWDASFEGKISDDALRAAENLVETAAPEPSG